MLYIRGELENDPGINFKPKGWNWVFDFEDIFKWPLVANISSPNYYSWVLRILGLNISYSKETKKC